MKHKKPNAYNVAETLSLTRFNCPVIIVGGTNGKGSTVTLLEQCYLKAGFKVAAFRSPFFEKINEEVCVNGQWISDDDLNMCLDKTKDASLSEFDHMTLAALYFFKKNEPDVILLEVGLGGRLDAVNVVEADLSVITNIDYDHTAILGDTLEKIAYEKAGIIKKNKPIIFGGDDLHLISPYAEEKQATLFALGRDFEAKSLPGSSINKNNVTLVLKAMSLLNNRLPISDALIKKTLPTVFLKGRRERVQENPCVIFDVAHNPSAARSLAAYLKKQSFKKVTAIFSMLDDKDIAGVVQAMNPVVDQWCLVPLGVSRAVKLDTLESVFLQLGITTYTQYASVMLAYEECLGETAPQEAIVLFGSFHLAQFYLK